MIIHDVKQGSREWDLLRLGMPTASNFHRILTPKTMELSAQSVRYMHWLLAEWLTGEPIESQETQWMQRGRALEELAVRSYCFETNAEVARVGFVTTDDKLWGCSPDRFIYPGPPMRSSAPMSQIDGWPLRGSLEIKCPAPQTHVASMLTRAIDDDHKAQVQGQMLICGLEWVDVLSYCPGLPTVIIRADRDEKFIVALEQALRAFSETMLEARIRLATEYGPFLREVTKADEAAAAEQQKIFDEIFSGSIAMDLY